MDGVVILVLMLAWFAINRPTQEVQEAVQIPTGAVQLNPYLNPSMYHDEQAFMMIANELGFH